MSETSELSASEWLDQNMGRIMGFSIRAGAVAYQGARIADAMQQLKPGAPRDIALAQLHVELGDEYAAMLAARQALPAQNEFRHHADAAQAELTETVREESALHVIITAERHEIEAEVEHAAEHAPAAEQQLMAYMQQRIAQLIGTRGVEQAWRGHGTAETVERFAGALAMMCYVPVPEYLSPEERAAIEARVVVAAPPAEPAAELPLDVHALAAVVREANPEVGSQGLNTLAALVLLQPPGRWFTAAELGSVLYGDLDQRKAAAKAYALLHHSLEGRSGRAGRILAEHGYQLVRGRAVVGEQTGQEVPRPVPVYGIVQLEAEGLAQ